MEKKKLEINCAKCDARSINEESYAKYDKIEINTAIMLIDDRSREVLSRLGAEIHAAKTLSAKDDVPVVEINGPHKITAAALPKKGTVLTVNGGVEIEKGANKAVEMYSYIDINGNLECPESIVSSLANVNVNGCVGTYPDDYIKLHSKLAIDDMFIARAAQNGKYYVGGTVSLTDRAVDASRLVEKNVKFKTKRFITHEDRLDESLPMFDFDTEIILAPSDCAIVGGSAKLNPDLLDEYGTRLFVFGNLDARGNIADVISRLEKLAVTGKITVTRKNAAAIRGLGAKYKKLEIVKEMTFANTASVRVTNEMLRASDGAAVQNCAVLTIDGDVSAEDIKNLLEAVNVRHIVCSKEQAAAVRSVCKNVGAVMTPEEYDEWKNSRKDNSTIEIDTAEYVM